MNADDENSALYCWPANPPSIRVRGRQTRAGIRDSARTSTSAGCRRRRRLAARSAVRRTLPRWRAAGAAGSPGYARRVGRLARTYCRVFGHTGDWTYPDERCARVRICERCREVTNKQEHTWTAFEYVANKRCERSAGVTGAVRLSHASCMNGVRGAMSVRSNTSARATPAVAVARRNTPATCHGSVDHLAPVGLPPIVRHGTRWARRRPRARASPFAGLRASP
jgi:hypothetical protein